MERSWELASLQETHACPLSSCPRVFTPIPLPDQQRGSANSAALFDLVGFSPSSSSSPPDHFPSLSSPPLQPGSLRHSQQPLQQLPIFPSHRASRTGNSSKTLLSSDGSATMSIYTEEKSMAAACTSASPASAGRVNVLQTQITEDVVHHATCSNFKEVVQQLTGAPSPAGKEVMPPGGAGRWRNKLAGAPSPPRNGKVATNRKDSLSVKSDASKGFRRKAPTTCKLEGRTKPLRYVQDLCSRGSDKLQFEPFSSIFSSAVPSPSPVTAVARNFVLSCSAASSADSQSSGCSSRVCSSEPLFPDQTDGSGAAPCIRAALQPYSTAVSRAGGGRPEETLHSPVLLSLFPECPMASLNDGKGPNLAGYA